ncbi:hypothetical protein Ahy_B06g080536 [Arachis hypogaea]|uniref:Uncharacterized protein n=1 Tax=Arachis hypogaea TaxID=3818 RepID=A0A444YIA1_ARAHY|nr:hypothetical protein Ahy_B06g080536 [Arachis hypogaea]
MIFQSFILDNLVYLCMKIMNLVVVVTLLWISEHILHRAQLTWSELGKDVEEGREEAFHQTPCWHLHQHTLAPALYQQKQSQEEEEYVWNHGWRNLLTVVPKESSESRKTLIEDHKSVPHTTSIVAVGRKKEP